MRKSLVGLLCTIALLHSTQYDSKAIVGYVNRTLYDGYNLINNPLDDSHNTASSIFSLLPAGSTLSLWDPVANAPSVTSTKLFQGGELHGTWTVDLSLPPGKGALLYLPSGSIYSPSHIHTYVGEAVSAEGSDLPAGIIVPPPLFSGPDGIHLLGSIMPLGLMEGTEFGVFEYILGRDAQVGEQFTRLNSETQTYTTTTYLGFDAWDNGVPELPVAESAFFNIGPVPEPTTFTLLGLGSLALVMVRRRR